MFEAFPSMKTQFAEMQSPFEKILTDSKPHPLSEHFDRLMQLYFQGEIQGEDEAEQKCLEMIASYEFQRKQFYQLLTKSCVKFLKKDLKKIQELIIYYNKPNQQSELNRIKLDKILKQCLGKIQQSSTNIYQFVEEMDGAKQWQCQCKKDQCISRQSYEQFIIDIFGFFIRTSQIFNDEIISALKRNKVIHKVFDLNFEAKKKSDWRIGHNPGELVLSIETDCQKSKSKKRRRNKKQKNKQKQFGQISDQLLYEHCEDEREKELNSFLQSLIIESNDRQQCIVTEQWLLRIAGKHLK